jgi:outer membrane protein OmpA-like peptidoglycan-associated protein
MKKASLWLILFLFSTAASAQSNAPITGQNYWGFDLGITSSAHFGAKNYFLTIVDDSSRTIGSYVPFDNLGSGIGFTGGAKVAFALSNNFDIAAKVRYLSNHTSTDEDRRIATDFDLSNNPTDSSNSTGTFAITTSNLSLAALLNFRLSNALYGIGGLEFSSLLGNTLEVSQSLKDGSTYNANGISTNVSSISHPAASEDWYFSKSRFAAQLGLGTAWQLSASSSTMLDAELIFSIPFATWISDSGRNATDATQKAFPFLQTVSYPTLWYASLTIGIRFPFSLGSTATGYAASESREAATSSGAGTETRAEIDAEGKVPLTGRVSDNSGKSVDANITVVDLTNNEVVATDKTGSDGRYSVRVKAPGRYSVTADADGYLFGTAYFEVDKDGRILSSHPDIKLSETTNGRTRLLVFFDFNSSELKSSSYPELNRAVKLMKAVPTMQVEIAGYTDSVGSVEFNKSLSERRANAVKDYLVKNGIAKKRVAAKGYGEESPIADNGTDEGRAENRRVEFVVLSK